MKLTAKQKRFCEEYLICLNATEAAVKAGYKEKTARFIGHENLTKPYIADYIKEKQKELSEKSGITAKMVIDELAKIGFCNVQDYLLTGNICRDFTKMEREKVAAVSSVKITEIIGETFTRTTTEFKLHDKKGALEMLGRHLGIFEKDNTQKQVDIRQWIYAAASELKSKNKKR